MPPAAGGAAGGGCPVAGLRGGGVGDVAGGAILDILREIDGVFTGNTRRCASGRSIVRRDVVAGHDQVGTHVDLVDQLVEIELSGAVDRRYAAGEGGPAPGGLGGAVPALIGVAGHAVLGIDPVAAVIGELGVAVVAGGQGDDLAAGGRGRDRGPGGGDEVVDY